MRIETLNPATEVLVESYKTQTVEDVLGVLAQVLGAFTDWRDLSVSDRAAFLPRLATVLRAHSERFASLITLEMGKPIRESRAEIEKCAWLCEVYAENAEAWLAEETVEADGHKHRVVYAPLGIVLSIMPWNFPFWQALRFAVPGLTAGNASILKHASNVPGCARAIEEAFVLAGYPANVFRMVFADHAAVAALIADPRVAGVSLTGSTEAGALVAAEAGRHLKKVVLELGGSDPFIVLEDSDIEAAARGALTGRMLCTGQSCIAAKRFIAVETVAAAFSARFAALMGELAIGDPMDSATQVGPMVNARAREELEAQLADTLAAGARLLCGGERLDRPGYYFAPTVVADVTPAMRLAREEVFGPVAPILVVKDEGEAIRVANDSDFGLGASVWTRDIARGERVARQLEAGSVFVNSIVKSDPRMPFGGVKQSGLGRELSSFGLREFTNVKGLNVYE